MARFEPPGAGLWLSRFFEGGGCDPLYLQPSLNACHQIEDRRYAHVLWNTSSEFDSSANRYWNALKVTKNGRHNDKDSPACIVYPEDAKEVLNVINSIADQHTPGIWALRSGGYNPQPLYSSTNKGVLVDVSRISATEYDSKTGLARIGTGSTLNQAFKVLDKYGVGFPAADMGEVGVGGYFLEGGFSPLSQEFGLAADNVVSFEVVLANGTIVEVNDQNDPLLFRGLKGYGYKLGIVTKITLQTVPINEFALVGISGMVNRPEQMMRAMQAFTEHNTDPKASVELSYSHGRLDNPILTLRYHGPNPPPHVFDLFKEPLGMSQISVYKLPYPQSLGTSLRYSIQAENRYQWRMVVPNLDKLRGPELYMKIHKQWKDFMAEPVKLNPYGQTQGSPARSKFDYIVTSLHSQPMSRMIARESNKRGGNAFMWDEKDGDFMLFTLTVSGPAQINGKCEYFCTGPKGKKPIVYFFNEVDKFWNSLTNLYSDVYPKEAENTGRATNLPYEMFVPDLARPFDQDGYLKTEKRWIQHQYSPDELPNIYDPKGIISQRSHRPRISDDDTPGISFARLCSMEKKSSYTSTLNKQNY